jgi:hypothetical protein
VDLKDDLKDGLETADLRLVYFTNEPKVTYGRYWTLSSIIFTDPPHPWLWPGMTRLGFDGVRIAANARLRKIFSSLFIVSHDYGCFGDRAGNEMLSGLRQTNSITYMDARPVCLANV